jgi:hypothetical protein
MCAFLVLAGSCAGVVSLKARQNCSDDRMQFLFQQHTYNTSSQAQVVVMIIKLV